MATVESRIGAEAGVGTFSNGSGADRPAGTLVVRDEAANSRFKLTTVEGDLTVLGVLVDSITSAGSGRVLLDGLVMVDVVGSVSRGDFLKTTTTAGKAAGFAAYTQGVFGVALTASSGGQVEAYFFGVELSSGETPHGLWSAHSYSLAVTAGAGLSVDYENGQAWVDGTFYEVTSGNLGGLTPTDTSYIFVDTSGTVAFNVTGFPVGVKPLAEVDTDGAVVTAVRDRRSYIDCAFPAAGESWLPVVGTPAYDDVEDMNTLFHSSGWFSGGDISDAGGGNIDVTAGAGSIRATDSSVGQLLFFDWAASAGLAITVDTVRHIGVEYNAGSPQVTVRTADSWNYNTDFPLGLVINEGGTLHIQKHEHASGDHASTMIQRMHETAHIARDNHGGGLALGETGARYVTMTAGGLWVGLSRFAIGAVDTSGADTFDTYSSAGAEAAGISQWPNEQYDDAGTLTAMTNNRWANLYWYLEVDGGLIMVYGTGQYTTEAQAENEDLPAVLPDRAVEHGILVARLIFQKSDVAASQMLSAFVTMFPVAGVTDHGNLAGLTGDDHVQYLLLGGRSTQGIDDDIEISGYLRVGSLATPVNATAGDLTVGRVLIGSDGVLASDRKFQVNYASPVAPAAGGFLGGTFNLLVAPAAATGDAVGLLTNMLVRPTADSGAVNQAMKFSLEHDSGAFDLTGATAMVGIQGQAVQNVAATTVANLAGMRAAVAATDGAVTTARAFDARLGLAGDSGSYTDIIGFDVADFDVPTGGATTVVGFRTCNLGVAGVTNAIGIDIAAQSGASTLNIGLRNTGTLLQLGTSQFDTAVDINAQVYLSAELVLDAASAISTISKSRVVAGNQFIDFDFDGLTAAEDARVRFFRSTASAGGDDRVSVYSPGTTTLVAEIRANTGLFLLPTQGSGAGISIGGDVQLYRSAADMLYIPDNVSIIGTLLVDNPATFDSGVVISGSNTVEFGGDTAISRLDAATLMVSSNLVVLGTIRGAINEISGSLDLVAVSSDPAYIDGNARVYFYSSGGVDEVRVRGKVGATETQVVIADITP